MIERLLTHSTQATALGVVGALIALVFGVFVHRLLRDKKPNYEARLKFSRNNRLTSLLHSAALRFMYFFGTPFTVGLAFRMLIFEATANEFKSTGILVISLILGTICGFISTLYILLGVSNLPDGDSISCYGRSTLWFSQITLCSSVALSALSDPWTGYLIHFLIVFFTLCSRFWSTYFFNRKFGILFELMYILLWGANLLQVVKGSRIGFSYKQAVMSFVLTMALVFRILKNWEYDNDRLHMQTGLLSLRAIVIVAERFKKMYNAEGDTLYDKIITGGMRLFIMRRHRKALSEINSSRDIWDFQTFLYLIFTKVHDGNHHDFEPQMYHLYYLAEGHFNLTRIGQLLRGLELSAIKITQQADLLVLRAWLNEMINSLYLQDQTEVPLALKLNTGKIVDSEMKAFRNDKKTDSIDTYWYFRTMQANEHLRIAMKTSIVCQEDLYRLISGPKVQVIEVKELLERFQSKHQIVVRDFARMGKVAHPLQHVHILMYATYLRGTINDFNTARRLMKTYHTLLDTSHRLRRSVKPVISSHHFEEGCVSLVINGGLQNFGLIDYCSENFERVFGTNISLTGSNLSSLIGPGLRSIHTKAMQELVDRFEVNYLGEHRVRYLHFESRKQTFRTVAVNRLFPSVDYGVKFVSMVRNLVISRDETIIVIRNDNIVSLDPRSLLSTLSWSEYLGFHLQDLNQDLYSIYVSFITVELKRIGKLTPSAIRRLNLMDLDSHTSSAYHQGIWAHIEDQTVPGPSIQMTLTDRIKGVVKKTFQVFVRMETVWMSKDGEFDFFVAVKLNSSWLHKDQELVDGYGVDIPLPVADIEISPMMNIDSSRQIRKSSQFGVKSAVYAVASSRRDISRRALVVDEKFNDKPIPKIIVQEIVQGNDDTSVGQIEDLVNRAPQPHKKSSNGSFYDETIHGKYNPQASQRTPDSMESQANRSLKHRGSSQNMTIISSQRSSQAAVRNKFHRITVNRAKMTILGPMITIPILQAMLLIINIAYLAFVSHNSVQTIADISSYRNKPNFIVQIDANVKEASLALIEQKLSVLGLNDDTKLAGFNKNYGNNTAYVMLQFEECMADINKLVLGFRLLEDNISAYSKQLQDVERRPIKFLINEDDKTYMTLSMTFVELERIIKQYLDDWNITKSQPLTRPLVRDSFRLVINEWSPMLAILMDNIVESEDRYNESSSHLHLLWQVLFNVASYVLVLLALLTFTIIRYRLTKIYRIFEHLRRFEILMKLALLARIKTAINRAQVDEEELYKEYGKFGTGLAELISKDTDDKQNLNRNRSVTQFKVSYRHWYGLLLIFIILCTPFIGLSAASSLVTLGIEQNRIKNLHMLHQEGDFMQLYYTLNLADYLLYFSLLFKTGLASFPDASMEYFQLFLQGAEETIQNTSLSLQNNLQASLAWENHEYYEASRVLLENPCSKIDLEQFNMSLDDCNSLGEGISNQGYMKVVQWTRLQIVVLTSLIFDSLKFDPAASSIFSSRPFVEQMLVNRVMHREIFHVYSTVLHTEIDSSISRDQTTLYNFNGWIGMLGFILSVGICVFFVLYVSQTYVKAVTLFEILPFDSYFDNGLVKNDLKNYFKHGVE